MIVPDFLQILIAAGKDVQAHRFIGFPIGFQNASDKRVIKPAVDQQMQIAMFFMWHLDGRAAQFIPGACHKRLQFLLIFVGQLLDGFMPECGFDMIAQFGILAEVIIVERQRIAQTLATAGVNEKSRRLVPSRGLTSTKPSARATSSCSRREATLTPSSSLKSLERREPVLRFLM